MDVRYCNVTGCRCPTWRTQDRWTEETVGSNQTADTEGAGGVLHGQRWLRRRGDAGLPSHPHQTRHSHILSGPRPDEPKRLPPTASHTRSVPILSSCSALLEWKEQRSVNGTVVPSTRNNMTEPAWQSDEKVSLVLERHV